MYKIYRYIEHIYIYVHILVYYIGYITYYILHIIDNVYGIIKISGFCMAVSKKLGVLWASAFGKSPGLDQRVRVPKYDGIRPAQPLQD